MAIVSFSLVCNTGHQIKYVPTVSTSRLFLECRRLPAGQDSLNAELFKAEPDFAVHESSSAALCNNMGGETTA